MAWFKLWKWFSPWSNRRYQDVIYWYSEYVLKSPAQREKEMIQNEKVVNKLMLELGIMRTMCSLRK